MRHVRAGIGRMRRIIAASVHMVAFLRLLAASAAALRPVAKRCSDCVFYWIRCYWPNRRRYETSRCARCINTLGGMGALRGGGKGGKGGGRRPVLLLCIDQAQ